MAADGLGGASARELGAQGHGAVGPSGAGAGEERDPSGAGVGGARDPFGARHGRDAAGPLGGVDVHVVDGGAADGEAAVRFWGSVDIEVRSQGTGTLNALRGSSAPMTVDCRDVTFMDSTGLSVLVRVVRDAAADGRPVRFLGAGEQVLELLRLTGVDEWMSRLGVQLGDRPPQDRPSPD